MCCLPVCPQEYEKEKLNERIARLSGGVAIIQVGRWDGREVLLADCHQLANLMRAWHLTGAR
jgi:hypothetical protein